MEQFIELDKIIAFNVITKDGVDVGEFDHE